jgi:hypothetical protein
LKPWAITRFPFGTNDGQGYSARDFMGRGEAG